MSFIFPLLLLHKKTAEIYFPHKEEESGCSIFANSPSWADYLASSQFAGIQLGQQLFASEQLQQWKGEGRAISFVFDQLLHLLAQVPTFTKKDAGD
jgi:hypothetical protein